MKYVWFFIFIALLVIFLLVLSHIRAIKKLKSFIINSFGKIPNQKCEFKSIESYHQHKTTNIKSSYNTIDGITWDDLDMNLVFKRINSCLTSVGEEYLYDTLHDIQIEESILLKREELILYLEKNPDERLKLQMNLAKAGKHNYSGLDSFIFNAEAKSLKFNFIYNILTVIPILCIFIFFSLIRMWDFYL